MPEILFIVKLELTESQTVEIPYEYMDECLRDNALKSLFDADLVIKCSVYCAGQRVTSLPVMTWERFKDQMISSSVTIMREYQRS